MAQLNAYIIEHMNTGVLAVDQDLTIRLMNETAWYLLGMPSTKVGEPLERACNLLPDMIRDWRKDTRGTAPLFRPQLGGAELKPAFAPLGVESGGILIFLEDSAGVTQQAQQLKLASLGRLTASIAHEIRNPLGAISHAGQLLAESPDLNGADQRLTEIIKANSKRVNTIIETVLQLSRREQARPRTLEPGQLDQGVSGRFRPHPHVGPGVIPLLHGAGQPMDLPGPGPPDPGVNQPVRQRPGAWGVRAGTHQHSVECGSYQVQTPSIRGSAGSGRRHRSQSGASDF